MWGDRRFSVFLLTSLYLQAVLSVSCFPPWYQIVNTLRARIGSHPPLYPAQTFNKALPKSESFYLKLGANPAHPDLPSVHNPALLQWNKMARG